MLNQSTPILERTKRAYIAYLERLCRINRKSYEGMNINDEVEETDKLIELISVELEKRSYND